MSRTLLVAAVWAILIALVVLLAHIAGPEPRRRTSLDSALIPPAPVELAVTYPAPITPQAEERIHYSPPAPVPPASTPTASQTTPPASTPAVAQATAPAPTPPPPAKPKPRFPQREGATESGIPGLGSLPAGPGPAYQGLGVQVYSRSNGQPVIGARVRFALQAQLDEWQRAHPETPLELADPETVLELCTQPVQTRTLGVALTDSAPGRMLVDARVGSQYGFAWIDRDKEARARIDLVEDRALTVHVVDQNGGPRADAGVVVRDSSCAQLWHGVTDAGGGARWPHAAFVIERDASPGNCIAMIEFVTAVPVVPIAREIQRPLGEQGDFEFTLTTSCGSLRVNVVDSDASLVYEPLRLTCAVSLDACAAGVQRTLEYGLARFDHVAPGCGPEIRIDGGTVFESVVRRVAGPLRELETQEVTLTCGRRFPVVRARLFGPDEKPLSKVKATAWLEFVGLDPAHALEALARVETDDTGSVRLTLPHAELPVTRGAAADAKQRLLIVAQNEFGDWCHATHIELKASLDERGLDLGECHLTEMPTLAGGYTLADRGWPVPNAVIEVSASDDPTADPESFTAYPRFAATADQMGRFRLRGLVPGARIALTASAPNHMRPPRRIVERGERKVSLELMRCASISGRLLPSPIMGRENTHVWIDVGDESIPATIDENLTWRCAGLPPGNAALRVTVPGLDEPVYSVPTLTLMPGIEFSDPQTTTIDLRTRITVVALYITNDHDERVAAGTAVVTEEREEGPFTRTFAFQNGLLEVVALRPAVDIEIHAAGFETLVVHATERNARVKLVPLGEK